MRPSIGLLLLALLSGSAAAQDVLDRPVTLASLLAEMSDLDRLATLPVRRYRAIQISSHDRRSTSPDRPHWFGNHDGFGASPEPAFAAVLEKANERGVGRYLVCDLEGPGALVRSWSAAMPGTMTVWLDGAKTPFYHGSAEAFLTARGRWYGRDVDGFAPRDAFHQQEANYFPVPFEKRLRIEYVGDTRKAHFYHLGVRRYSVGLLVQSCPPRPDAAITAAMRRASDRLVAPPTPAGVQVPLAFAVPAGGRASHACDGPGAVRRLRLRLEATAKAGEKAADRDASLRAVMLRIRFDDASVAQVEAPLGDFFGPAPGVNPFRSLPMQVAADGTMTCDFVMPFRERAEIELENLTDAPVKVTGEAIVAPFRWGELVSLYSRASWRVSHDVTADAKPDRALDVPILAASGGAGRLVGTALTLLNPSPVPTAWGNWWGEGDEKFWVDGEARPSWFGTGTEDYFNYAWSRSTPFAHPYCALPYVTGPGHRGYVSNLRWHVLDDVPFTRSIEAKVELIHHSPTPGMSIGVTNYWYAQPGVRDVRPPIGRRDLVVPPLEPWLPVARFGSAGATFHQLELTEFEGHGLPYDRLPLSGRGGIVWRPKAVGDTLSLPYPTAEETRYRFGFTMLAQPGAGAFRVRVAGTPLARRVDGRRVDPATPIDLAIDGKPRLLHIDFEPIPLGVGDFRIVLESTRTGDVVWDYYSVQLVQRRG